MRGQHIAAIAAAMTLLAPVRSGGELPQGWLLGHSYTSYAAQDSRLYLRSPDGTVTEITGDFCHAMNGSFGSTPGDVVFMAIDPAQDEWDIYRYRDGEVENLTQGSGLRNEDPKWMPDGKNICFKRGRWDAAQDGFRYDLALLDADTGEVTMLTDDAVEEAMPYPAPDRSIYYAAYDEGEPAICRLLPDGTRETVYAEPGCSAYYPVAAGEAVYFTRWHSAAVHTDGLYRLDGTEAAALPFNSPDYDCSDACPAGDCLVFSSTRSGSYDLYCYDGEAVTALPFAGTGRQELGAAFFPCTAGDVDADGIFSTADVLAMQRYLLCGKPLRVPAAGDLDGNGELDVYDLGRMKRALLKGGTP